MTIMVRLHTELFAGLPGELFLAVMGLLFVAAIVSGLVLYGPFTRRLDFGEIRAGRSRRTRWLDRHNLLGIVTLAWALVVGVTGTMNELSAPLFAFWQRTDVAAMLAPWQDKAPPRPDQLSSPQAALETAQRAVPDMIVTSILYPGGRLGSPHHYVMFTKGKTPLTSRLFTPVLIDARTGRLTALVPMPWYLRALEISRPLHFGDYGGLPLKIIWALLDLVTIIVLASGLYLWLSKHRLPAAKSQTRPSSGIGSARILEAAECDRLADPVRPALRPDRRRRNLVVVLLGRARRAAACGRAPLAAPTASRTKNALITLISHTVAKAQSPSLLQACFSQHRPW